MKRISKCKLYRIVGLADVKIIGSIYKHHVISKIVTKKTIYFRKHNEIYF